MLQGTCANSISKSILNNFYKTYFFCKLRENMGLELGVQGRKVLYWLVVVFLVSRSGNTKETQRTQFRPPINFNTHWI